MVSPTLIISLVLTVSLVASAGQAQSPLPSAPPQGPAIFTPDQLDQLLAPIALHPDPLVGQILMAATYPLEVVQATRWLQDPSHAALTGPALAAALDLRPWDPSVKALVSFPQILRMMDGSLDWTEAVGDAFLSDQAAVMDAIQRLRQRAQSAGTLVSTEQQMVFTADQAIGIVPADPQVVYVPTYDPGAVYGTWVYAPSPFFGYPSPLVVAPLGGVGGLSFGVAIVVVPSLWGWHHWDWHRHRLHVDHDRFSRIGGHRPPPGGIWQHDPGHRRGVPYRDPGTRARFLVGPYGDVRGYGTGPSVGPGTRPGGSILPPPAAAPPKSPVPTRVTPAPGGAGSGPAVGPGTRPGSLILPPPAAALPKSPVPTRVTPAPGGAGSGPAVGPGTRPGSLILPPPAAAPPKSPVPTRVTPAPGGALRPLAPAFESFGRGADVHTHTERGQSSRQTIAPASPRAPATPPSGGTRSGGTPSGGARSGETKSGSGQGRR